MSYYVSIFLKGIRDKKFLLALLIILLSMIFSLSALKKKKPNHFAVREETEFDLIQKINENQ